MPPHHVTDAALQALYDQIPAIPGCDRRCWTSCGPVGMSDREGQRIRRAGVRITPYEQAMAKVERFWCEALTGDKRCAVYDMRPMICRLWGAVESLPCRLQTACRVRDQQINNAFPPTTRHRRAPDVFDLQVVGGRSD